MDTGQLRVSCPTPGQVKRSQSQLFQVPEKPPLPPLPRHFGSQGYVNEAPLCLRSCVLALRVAGEGKGRILPSVRGGVPPIPQSPC